MSEKNQGLQGRREMEVDTLQLGNDKNNVIADKVLFLEFNLCLKYASHVL